MAVVHNWSAAERFFRAMSTRRVALALIGDSNIISASVSGHIQGVEKAWANARGIYSTGTGPYAAGGGAASSRNGVAMGRITGFNASTPPTELSTHVAGGLGLASLETPYGYLSDSESISAGGSHYQLVVRNSGGDVLFDLAARLRWHWTHGTFPTGTGSFQPCCRGESSLTFYAEGDARDPVTGSYGLVDDYLEIPAGARSHTNLGFEPFKVVAGPDLTGPFFAIYQQLELPDVTAGVAVSGMLYQGGMSARNAAELLQGATLDAKKEYLRQLVRTQTGDPMLMIEIKHGGNDRIDDEVSLGPNPAVSNTPEGFKDNYEAIVVEVKEAWAALGYDANDLFFQFGPYHPQDGHEATLESYYDAALELADEIGNTVVVYGTRLTTASEMTARGWYASGVDDAHLSQDGYEGLARLSTSALLRPSYAGGPRGLSVASPFSGIHVHRNRTPAR